MGWRFWQWIDSSFPSGGYAHSLGLEAWSTLAPRDADVEQALASLLESQLSMGLPHLCAAFERGALLDPTVMHRLDLEYDAELWGPIANRASRAQGRGLTESTLRSVGHLATLQPAREWLADPAWPLHHNVVFGALAGAFSSELEQVREAYAFALARAAVSAAVRLNLLGPFAGQRVLATLAERAREVLAAPPRPSASTAPFLDLLAERHDTLHTRLFSS